MRIFSKPTDASGLIKLNADDLNHLRAHRIRADEVFTVCDGAGVDFICKLRQSPDGSYAEITDEKPSIGEPDIKCTVFAALAKGDKTDLVVQKSVELGAFGIVLFHSSRCVSTPDEKAVQKKIARLSRISLEAAKQSGRGVVPEISFLSDFKSAALKAVQSDVAVFLYENESETAIKSVLDSTENPKTIAIMTGPEGGFDNHEANLAKNCGMRPASLGNRILRCDTAPLCALTAVMYHFNQLA